MNAFDDDYDNITVVEINETLEKGTAPKKDPVFKLFCFLGILSFVLIFPSMILAIVTRCDFFLWGMISGLLLLVFVFVFPYVYTDGRC